MIIRYARFNTYLLCGMLLVAQFGCKTSEKKKAAKQKAALGLHLEVSRDDLGRGKDVPISRASSVKVYVDKEPFLDEGLITEARLIDDRGGFSIYVQLEKRGAWLLEQYTGTNPGRHIAIHGQWGEKFEKTRWLGAPQITRRVSDGRFMFTPDATREEAEQLVRGLNNVAIQNGFQEKAKSKPKSE
jgi:preprotein translocase subunit SecD